MKAALALIPTVLLCQDAAITPGSPRPRAPNQMLFDAQRGQVVILAAANESGEETLWTWDGKRWSPISGAGPAARELGGAVYDSRRQRIVLYGGAGVGPRKGRLDDTWERNGAGWQQKQVAGPGARDHHSMTYDEARGKTVVYGGNNAEGVLDAKTWEWDGARWTAVATEGPGGGGAHLATAFDSVRKKVILFGGMDRNGRSHNETWAWDGAAWERLATEGPAPERRYRHRMVFDSHRGEAVLFGGLLPKGPPASVGDTWIWDGQRWREVAGAGPAARNSHVMAYDPVRRKTVLYGGGSFDGNLVTNYQDTWEWDGSKWTRVD